MNAFPIAIPAGCEGYEDGMTLRDYFAGQALAGITGDPSVEDMDQNEIARAAYLYADAMLEARGE
jgi:hypothetical protein